MVIWGRINHTVIDMDDEQYMNLRGISDHLFVETVEVDNQIIGGYIDYMVENVAQVNLVFG